MKNRRKSIWLAIILALMLTFVIVSIVWAITVDGENTGGEWDGINPIIVDETNEPVISDTVDIRTIWSVCSDSEAYFRVDTWSMPPDFTGIGRAVSIYLDTDNNGGTGCNDQVGHTGAGFEALIYATSAVVVVYQCDSGSWSAQGTGSSGFNNILEISASLSDLGMNCGDPTGMFFFYDGGTTAPDDEIPESGSITLIELISFIASAQAGSVQIEWQTASEIDNAGFNLYRSDGGEYARLNAALIPAQGGPTVGASYAYDDVDVVPGTTYAYMLEDVDVNGQAMLHGPVSVEVGEMPTAIEVHAFGASRAAAWLPTFVLVFGAMGLAWTWRRRRR